MAREAKWLNSQKLQSCVGWSDPEGSRPYLDGALLLGYYSDGDKLIYAGRVGTGMADTGTKTAGELAPSVAPKRQGPQTWAPRSGITGWDVGSAGPMVLGDLCGLPTEDRSEPGVSQRGTSLKPAVCFLAALRRSSDVENPTITN